MSTTQSFDRYFLSSYYVPGITGDNPVTKSVFTGIMVQWGRQRVTNVAGEREQDTVEPRVITEWGGEGAEKAFWLRILSADAYILF